MKGFYEILYRYFRAPWDIGPREELVTLVDTGVIPPGRAIDLGCGAGANAIFLAQHGFDVTGIDFAPAALDLARRRASQAGVQINLVLDDLTHLSRINDTFDFLLDYGVLDDLPLGRRESYLKSILPLTCPGSRYLLWGFEYPVRWWEYLIPFFDVPFSAGEVQQRFGSFFEIRKIAGELNWSRFPPGYAAYLMTRK